MSGAQLDEVLRLLWWSLVHYYYYFLLLLCVASGSHASLTATLSAKDEGTPYYGTESALAGALPVPCKLSETTNRPQNYSRSTLPFASFSPGGSSPPTRLLILEVTSPVSRHPRIHGNIRNSSVSLSTQTCSLRAGRWRGFPSQEVRPTSSRHTGVGGIRLFWDSASDGPPSEGGAIPSELLGAESRITPLP